MSEATTETKFLETMDPAQREFFELMMKKEDLHPELARYLEPHKTMGQVLKHPLVFELFYTPQSNARLNKQYEHKLDYIQKKLAERNWSGYLWMFERPYRMEKFIEIMHDMTDEEYWDILSSIWTDSENLWQYGSVLGHLIRNERPGRENMMDAKEKAFMEKLPEEITIYRGHQGRRNRRGWSWSLSHFKARWFAERFEQRGAAVAVAKIKKSEVIAYLSGRNEYEIIADPKALAIKTMKSPKRPEWLQAIVQEAKDGFQLKGRSYHGIWHWEKVERNAIKLAKMTPEADKLVVRLFALLHDSQRLNENDDPEHGQRAADYVKKLYKEHKLPIGRPQLELLMYACKLHEAGQTSENATVGVCWDADRLDLPRVGITPDPDLLSTKAGKEMIWRV